MLYRSCYAEKPQTLKAAAATDSLWKVLWYCLGAPRASAGSATCLLAMQTAQIQPQQDTQVKASRSGTPCRSVEQMKACRASTQCTMLLCKSPTDSTAGCNGPACLLSMGTCLLLPLLPQLGDVVDVGLLLLHLLLLPLCLYCFAEFLVLTLLLPVVQQQHTFRLVSRVLRAEACIALYQIQPMREAAIQLLEFPRKSRRFCAEFDDGLYTHSCACNTQVAWGGGAEVSGIHCHHPYAPHAHVCLVITWCTD